MAKSSKPSKFNRKLRPFTPIRRFFFKLELLKPPALEPDSHSRGKLHENSDMNLVVDTPPENRSFLKVRTRNIENSASVPPSHQLADSTSAFPKRACVALQNEDTIEDAIIITALDTIPFCCHEDLLTMSREKLIAVAVSLNDKLPAVLSIDVGHTRSTSVIRNSIELIVGIRDDVPQAPKAVRSRPQSKSVLLEDFDMHTEMNRSPPTSPLSRRSRSYELYTSLGSPRLERLEEEEENVEPWTDRLQKRRKVSAAKQVADLDVTMGAELTPTPLPRVLRAQSLRAAPSASPTPQRVLRSHSQKIPGKSAGIDTTFVNTTRPAYRYRSKRKATRAEVESAKETRSAVPPSGAPTARRIRIRPISGYRPFLVPASHTSTSTGNISTNSGSSRVSLGSSPESPVSVVGRKRKRSFGHTEDESEMASGIGDMNMGKSNSDMDLCK